MSTLATMDEKLPTGYKCTEFLNAKDETALELIIRF